jgi:hypothetical protein
MQKNYIAKNMIIIKQTWHLILKNQNSTDGINIICTVNCMT